MPRTRRARSASALRTSSRSSKWQTLRRRRSDTFRGLCRRPRRCRRPALRRSRAGSPRGGRARRRLRSMPPAIARAIASGSSQRGLSRRHDHAVGEPRRDPRPSATRLPRSRSPPQPNTTISRAARRLARRAQHVLERVGRVRVVDDRVDAEGRDPLHAARERARGRREPARDRRVVDARARARSPNAASALRTLKRPGQRERDAQSRRRGSGCRRRRARRRVARSVASRRSRTVTCGLRGERRARTRRPTASSTLRTRAAARDRRAAASPRRSARTCRGNRGDRA